MSAVKPVTRTCITSLAARKGGEPIVMLTAATAPFARLLDGHVDILLVGDSLAMVLYGMDSTLGVSLDTMIAHTRAVVQSSRKSCVILDMPFGSYQESPEQAYRNCARAMAESGAQGVKLEGGAEMAPTVKFLVERGIPVMGHVGLMPQHFHRLGGFKVQGREASQEQVVLRDASAIAEAGAFSLVLEGVVEILAQKVTQQTPVPIIGIGASIACDGQVLVTEDLLGLTPRAPKFVKRYADLSALVTAAVEAYAAEVRARKFPANEQTYS